MKDINFIALFVMLVVFASGTYYYVKRTPFIIKE